MVGVEGWMVRGEGWIMEMEGCMVGSVISDR